MFINVFVEKIKTAGADESSNVNENRRINFDDVHTYQNWLKGSRILAYVKNIEVSYYIKETPEEIDLLIKGAKAKVAKILYGKAD